MHNQILRCILFVIDIYGSKVSFFEDGYYSSKSWEKEQECPRWKIEDGLLYISSSQTGNEWELANTHQKEVMKAYNESITEILEVDMLNAT